MRWLYILRHAKSSWDAPDLADFDRPLAPRGRRAAPRMGAYMRRHGLIPELALCSAARRARETFDLVAAELGLPVPVRFLPELYGAGPTDLLRHVRQTPDNIGRLLLVGHNPAIERLATAMAAPATVGGNHEALPWLGKKYPTAALAVLAFEATRWADLAAGGGRLERFVKPSDLG